MFENFIEEKTLSEKEVILNLDEISEDAILKSDLSDFSKNFISYDFKEGLSKDDLIARVEKSNKLCFNYTIRPGWTLINFLFSNFESRPPNEILKKIRIFPFYKFYTDAIQQSIKDNFQIFVTKNELTSIVNDTNAAIHEKLTNDTSGLKIKNFFLQVFKLKYEAESDYNLESTIPYPLIRMFLEDKHYNDLEKKFRNVRDSKDGAEISLKDIIKILTNKLEPQVNRKPDEKPSPKIAEKEISVTETAPEKKPPQAEVKIQKEDSPIYSEQLMQAEKEAVKEHEQEERSPALNSDIENLFDESNIQKITAKIYKSDEIYKDISFEKLSNYRTWFEASKHLKEIFETNKVDIYSKDVIKFVNVLNDYFQNKE